MLKLPHEQLQFINGNMQLNCNWSSMPIASLCMSHGHDAGCSQPLERKTWPAAITSAMLSSLFAWFGALSWAKSCKHLPCAGLAFWSAQEVPFMRTGDLLGCTAFSLKQRLHSGSLCAERSATFFTTSVSTRYILPWASWTCHLDMECSFNQFVESPFL